MAKERDSRPLLTRRQFLIGLGATIGGAAIAGCAEKIEAETTKVLRVLPTSSPSAEPSKTPRATETSRPTRVISPTETPKPIPTVESLTNLPGVEITQKYLIDGLVGIGGADPVEVVTPIASLGIEIQSWTDVINFYTKNWDSEAIFDWKDITENPLAILKFAITTGDIGGFDGTTYNFGKQFPMLENFRLFRSQIKELEGENPLETAINAIPINFEIRKSTNMTVIGRVSDGVTSGVAVSFSEGFDRAENDKIVPLDVARLYFAVILETLPENEEGVSLERIINATGNEYQRGKVGEKGKIIFGEEGDRASWEINDFDLEMSKIVMDAAGMFFADKKPDGTYYENPIIPNLSDEQKKSHEFLMPKLTEEGVYEIWGGKTAETPKLLYTAVYNESNNIWSWAESINIAMEKAPKVPGLIAKMDGEKLIYVAEAGNPYGLEVNQYGGEFNPNVLVMGERAGGLVLAPSVAEKILKDQLAAISDPNEKWLIPLPVDISKASKDAEINVDITGSYGGYPVSVVEISFSESLPLVYSIPDSHYMSILNDYAYGRGINDETIRGTSECMDRICPGKEMFYLAIAGNFDLPAPVFKDIDFGNVVTETNSTVRIIINGGFEVRNFNVEKIFKVDNTVVFIGSK